MVLMVLIFFGWTGSRVYGGMKPLREGSSPGGPKPVSWGSGRSLEPGPEGRARHQA